ncbi:MAG TPA: hypothetical protein VKA28_03375 [Candidatus Bathyarchaeia archaeon]|nr:hypothetical protein [Candidatus Bathyarchaeia archaeon]
MNSVIAKKVLNSIIWIASGVLVIIIRVLIIQSTSILAWELLGGGMVAYGSFRLLWALARGVPTESSIP